MKGPRDWWVRISPYLEKAWKAVLWWFSRSARTWVTVFVACFLVSTLAFCLKPHPVTRIYLEFPLSWSNRWNGEVRYTPLRYSREKQAMQVVKELLVGPENLSSIPLFPRGTQVASLMLRKNTVYVDLSVDFGQDGGPQAGYRRSVEKVRDLVKLNVLGIGDVKLTINGSEVYVDPPVFPAQKTSEGKSADKAPKGSKKNKKR